MSRLDKFEEILKSYEGRSFVTDSSCFAGLEWEAIAPKRVDENNKEVFCYDDSQQRILDAGFERHPSSAEAFALICAYLDDEKNKTNLLTQEQAELAKDMLVTPGEFFCQAIETTQVGKENKALFYELVTALSRNAENTGYEKAGMKYSGCRQVDISDLIFDEHCYYKNIHEKHDALIKYFTSRSFNDLPEEIKEEGGIYLPAPGKMWPVGRDDFGDGGFVINGYVSGVSRGVRRVQKKVAA